MTPVGTLHDIDRSSRVARWIGANRIWAAPVGTMSSWIVERVVVMDSVQAASGPTIDCVHGSHGTDTGRRRAEPRR